MVRPTTAALALLSATTTVLALPAANNITTTDLPIVDLGYELHQASFLNETGGFYNFSNIRYAAPPTGQNRFTYPQAPAVNRDGVQTGNQSRICPQAGPAWQAIAGQFVPQYLLTGQTEYNQSSFNTTSAGGGMPQQDPRTDEDCLFMDVVVPQSIYESAGTGFGAPVLVWIYGGGYTMGSKDGAGNPAGLLKRAENNGNDGVIYVSFNYRLGAFGWLSGPTFQANGTANLGLHDQRFALEWVQANIAKFGGDPNRVTVFGESAGGGSIMHHITAYGGNNGSAPFAQAVPQSPGWVPVVSNRQQEQTFQDYLALLNVSTIQEARELPYEALQQANIQQVAGSVYGGFTYGPVVDGNYVPALPGELLLHGQYDKSIRLMVGHNAQEGLIFTSPFAAQNETAAAAQITGNLPTIRAWPEVLDYILQTAYPPVYDGSQAQNYTDPVARTSAIIAELVFTCNTNYLNRAFGNKTFAYFFTVPPALHGQDIDYSYYNDGGVDPSDITGVQSVEVALALQEYITSFAMTGNPNSDGVPFFPTWGSNATVQMLGADGLEAAFDRTANERCEFWQRALYV